MNMDKLPYLGELQFHILTKKFFSLLEIFTRHKAQAPDQRGRGLGLGTRRGEGARTGKARPSSSWLPELLGRGRHKTQAQPSPRFCGAPEGWNRAQRRARSV